MSYWVNNGKFQAKLETLHTLIDSMLGPNGVKNPTKNKQLERLRKMKNQYYRLFNDGTPSRLLGIESWQLKRASYYHTLIAADAALSLQIVAAWDEQHGFCNC